MRQTIIRRTAAVALAACFLTLPIAAVAQTAAVNAPRNKYKVEDDVKLGLDAARKVDNQFPILRDADATAYVSRVGERLVASIPPDLRQPAFDYSFKIVDARDINAFALPGGPMYVNRGMIEAARNEGEMAGVMAHEISHVALRHATAQATKQSSAKNTLGQLGLILGGAILGGQTGAQLGAMGAAAWMTKYSREYETQADMLGARIMADAGYDPRDLANMFQTIAGQRTGGGNPEWLSSHPDPGNRFQKINREAASLRVSRTPIRMTRDLERVQARFRSMPRSRTMAEIERDPRRGQEGGQQGGSPTATRRYGTIVPVPSTQVRSYSGLSGVTFSVPSNWREFPAQDVVQFAPEGAYGEQGITRGTMIGILRSGAGDLEGSTEGYVNEVLQGNPYLAQRNTLMQTTVAGRPGLTTSLSGRSTVTGRTETVMIYTTQARRGEILYVVTVAPSDEAQDYNGAFRRMLNSIRFSN